MSLCCGCRLWRIFFDGVEVEAKPSCEVVALYCMEPCLGVGTETGRVKVVNKLLFGSYVNSNVGCV